MLPMLLAARTICALFTVALLTACSATNDGAVLQTLKGQLAAQNHQCVPLGWTPVPVAGTYYPGVSVTLHEEGVWFAARWLGRVRTRDLARPDVRAAYDVLNELARGGMLEREHFPGVFQYHLTMTGQQFFYDDSAYGNNPDHIPYLCYSTIVPQRITYTSSISPERYRDGARDVDGFVAAFDWTPSPVAAWADNAFMRAHSVTLGPTENPMVAHLVNLDGEWTVTQLSGTASPTARVVDIGAWPHPRL
jgi:hypothetical protein